MPSAVAEGMGVLAPTVGCGAGLGSATTPGYLVHTAMGPQLCWGWRGEEGPGHLASKASTEDGHGTQNVTADGERPRAVLSAQAAGRSPHPPQARGHRLS